MANIDVRPKRIDAVLKQIFGEKLNEEYGLTGSQVLIGRSPVCQIKLSSLGVSRKHCILTYSNDGWSVKDNESQNGTYINGRKLEPKESYLLQCGDILFLGPPSEMPQAYAYNEIFEGEREEMGTDDDDMIELPAKRPSEQNAESFSKKTAKTDSQISETEIFKKHAEFHSSYSSPEPNHKELKKTSKNKKRFDTKVETHKPPPKNKRVTCVNRDSGAVCKSLASTIKETYSSDQIYESSSRGSDKGEDSESLLFIRNDVEIDPMRPSFSKEEAELDTDKICKKSESKDTGNDKDLESKLAELSEQVKILQASKLELLKNYEDVCAKNKTLDQQLSEKEKKLQEDLQQCEVKAKNEVKSELLGKFEEDLICNICTELFIKPIVLDCSHTFCEFCIKEWKKKKNECPICRNKIKTMTQVRTLGEFIDKTLATLTPEQRMKRDDVIATRYFTEVTQHYPKQGSLHTPRRRRSRVRRDRTGRTPINAPIPEIQILGESSATRPSFITGRLPNLQDEPNMHLNVPSIYELPVLRFFFSR